MARWTALAFLLSATIAPGCADTTALAAPLSTSGIPTRSGSAFIWAMVVDDAGGCIPQATITVGSGPISGTFLQDSECDAWSSSGGVLFHNLAPGTTMTLRANAPGYSPLEKAVVAAVSGQAVDFALEPIPQS